MSDEHEGQQVWPPAPLFRPPLPKPGIRLKPLWAVLFINAGSGLLLGGYHVFQGWSHHRGVDWWGAVFVGLCLFVTTTGVHLLARHHAEVWNRKHTEGVEEQETR